MIEIEPNYLREGKKVVDKNSLTHKQVSLFKDNESVLYDWPAISLGEWL
jgi:hypothetical protein